MLLSERDCFRKARRGPVAAMLCSRDQTHPKQSLLVLCFTLSRCQSLSVSACHSVDMVTSNNECVTSQ